MASFSQAAAAAAAEHVQGPGGEGAPPPKPEGHLRFVAISDTHGLHRDIDLGSLPPGDYLLHGGDLTNTGELQQLRDFVAWADELCASGRYKQALIIAGNHDVTVDEAYYTEKGTRFHGSGAYSVAEARAALTASERVVYLEDSGVTLEGGLRVWGSPWQPEFCDWAFNLDRGAPLVAKWAQIPTGTDVVITHGPAWCLGDFTAFGGGRVGCQDLRKELEERVRPALHVSGHIHEAYGAGLAGDPETLYVNASTCNLAYRPVQAPIVVDVLTPEAAGAAAAPPAQSRARVVFPLSTAAAVHGSPRNASSERFRYGPKLLPALLAEGGPRRGCSMA